MWGIIWNNGDRLDTICLAALWFSAYLTLWHQKKRWTERPLKSQWHINCHLPERSNYGSLIYLYYIKKELTRYIMEVSGTPIDGGVLTLEFDGRMITFSEPSPGKVPSHRLRLVLCLTTSLWDTDMKQRITSWRKLTIRLSSLQWKTPILKSSQPNSQRLRMILIS